MSVPFFYAIVEDSIFTFSLGEKVTFLFGTNDGISVVGSIFENFIGLFSFVISKSITTLK